MTTLTNKFQKAVHRVFKNCFHFRLPNFRSLNACLQFFISSENKGKAMSAGFRGVNEYMRRNRAPETSKQPTYDDSVKKGRETFAKLISPIPIPVFFKQVWEKRPLYIARSNPTYYQYLCTLQDFKDAIERENIFFGENIDVSNYVNGVKVTETIEGRVTAKLIWELCKRGNSVRLLNPQTFIFKIREVQTELQDYLRCFVGSNIYITPESCQGFAPHYDDVEAFVLQLAGKKEWKIYKPREGEDLARFSSENFTEGEVGEPILKVVLEPGDLLYFPRGIIHQAKSLEEGSMHITVSCYQRNTWADFLEKLLPVALENAIAEDKRYRKGLPRNYLDHLGMIYSEKSTKSRKKMITHLQHLVKNLTEHLPIDSCADQFGKDFVHDSLPPILTEDEVACTINGDCTGLKEKLLENRKKTLKVKLIRAYVCRLVCEDGKFKLFYNTKNSLKYHETSHRFIPLSTVSAAMTEALMKKYPEFISLQDLQSVACKSDNLEIVATYIEKLCKKGLILFNRRLSDD